MGNGPPQSTPAGWYEDPRNPALWRYFDGSAWANDTAPRFHTEPDPVQPAPPWASEAVAVPASAVATVHGHGGTVPPVDRPGLGQLFLSPEGRIGRGRYWAGQGVLFAANILGMFLMVGGAFALGAVIFLVTIVPRILVEVKRWHDRGKSGWFVLVGFIPLVGPIWVLVECGCLRGSIGPNRYGPDPLGGS